jgi:hypothetical protein
MHPFGFALFLGSSLLGLLTELHLVEFVRSSTQAWWPPWPWQLRTA